MAWYYHRCLCCTSSVPARACVVLFRLRADWRRIGGWNLRGFMLWGNSSLQLQDSHCRHEVETCSGDMRQPPHRGVGQRLQPTNGSFEWLIVHRHRFCNNNNNTKTKTWGLLKSVNLSAFQKSLWDLTVCLSHSVSMNVQSAWLQVWVWQMKRVTSVPSLYCGGLCPLLNEYQTIF